MTGRRTAAPRLPGAVALSSHKPLPGAERGYVAADPVEFFAAGQAPGAADNPVAGVADPEPGRALPAMDAELNCQNVPHGTPLQGPRRSRRECTRDAPAGLARPGSPGPVPGYRGHAAIGGDRGHRRHGVVDLVRGVVEVEAQ